jgi:hypothetical protein
MTLSTTAARVNYAGPGSGPFTIPFRFTVATDLQVIKRSSAGVETTLTLTTHYTVAGTGGSSASLTLISALVSGETLSIVRAPTIDQAVSLANQLQFYGSTHEAEFDRLVMQLQQLKDAIDRSFKLQDSYDPNGISTKVIPETGKALVWQSLTQLGNSALDASATALPGSGRTVATLTAYLLNNAVYNVLDYATGVSRDILEDAALQAAVDAVPATGGIVLLAPTQSLAATVNLPTDRHIVLMGYTRSAHWTNVNGGSVGGSIIKRKAGFTTGPLISQAKVGSVSGYGAAILDCVFDGNGLAGDLLSMSNIHGVELRGVRFVNSPGNGLVTLGAFYNAKIIECRFYEVGSTGGTPTYGVKFTSSADGAANNVAFVECDWEVGQGGYFCCSDPTGTHPIDQIKFVNGKMEFSGNNEATTPATPFADFNNTERLLINGTQFVNGQSNAATHIKLTNVFHSQLLGIACITSTATDGLNPQYFVDILSGDSIRVSGLFYRGGGNAGAQIRVNAAATNVTLDPRNSYDSPVGTGVPVKWGSTPSAMERVGTGWTGLQSTTALALGAGTVLEGPSRGNSICRVSAGGSNVILSAGSKGDMFAIVHQGTQVPLVFNPTDATSRVYMAANATILPGEAGIFFWDSTLALWVKMQARQRSTQTVAYAANITPDPTLGEIIEVGALTGALAIGAPSGNKQTKGMRLTFRILQDGTGGRAVTFNAVFKHAWFDTGNTAGKLSTIHFYFDGTNWVQFGAQSPYL